MSRFGDKARAAIIAAGQEMYGDLIARDVRSIIERARQENQLTAAAA